MNGISSRIMAGVWETLKRSLGLRAGELTQPGQQTVYFSRGVVMHEADAEETTAFLDAEALGQVQRVVISIPGEDAAVAEKLRDFRGVMIADATLKALAALVEAAWSSRAPEERL